RRAVPSVPHARNRAGGDRLARPGSDSRRLPALGRPPDDGSRSGGVRRAVVVAAVLAGLAIAAPAYAGAPTVSGGSAIGRNQPMVASGPLAPPVQLFGNPITARIAVVYDRKWVDPANLRVLPHFAPYAPIAPATVAHSGSGRVRQMSWTWTLRCLTS